jgi:hypothetical protein
MQVSDGARGNTGGRLGWFGVTSSRVGELDDTAASFDSENNNTHTECGVTCLECR